MKKPKPSCEIRYVYTIPKQIRDKLEMEPYILTMPLVKFCNPVDHIKAIPLVTLDQINIVQSHLDIVRHLYDLKDLHEIGYQLRAPVKDYITKSHEYCAGNAFKKKFISQAEKVLKENEGYLMQHKLKLSKKKTQQETDLLAVDYTRKAVKNYRGEVLGDQTNMEEGSSSSATKTDYNEGQGSSSSHSGQEQDGSQDENSEPVNTYPEQTQRLL